MKKTMGVVLIVFLLFLGTLFFREQRLPRWVVDRIEAACGTESFAIRVDGVSFGFRHGLRLQGVRAYDLEREHSLENPIGGARLVSVDWLRRRVEVVEAEYRRLPDSYYDDTKPLPRIGRVEVDLPDLPDFDLVLERPEILGLSPDRVTSRVRIGRGRVELGDLHVQMADRVRRLHVDGSLTLDFETQRLTCRVEGQVRHAQIAPVVEVLNVPYVLPYVAAFTEVRDPIPTVYTIDCSLYSGDFDMWFHLHVPACRYQGVPMASADGSIGVQTYRVGDVRNYRFTLELPRAFDREGRKLSGRLTSDNLSGPCRLGYDVTSNLRFADFLSLIDVFDPSTFESFVSETPPEMSFKGTSGTTPDDLDGNDMTGTLSLGHGRLGRLKVNELKATFGLKRDELTVQAEARGKSGGKLVWEDRLSFRGFAPDRDPRFTLKGEYRNGSLEEAADFFTFDMGERTGKVDAELELSGLLGTNMLASLDGKGSVKVHDGKLAQMKLFAGLTEQLAKHLPGVSFLVDQTEASANFMIENGVVKSDDIYIEGGLVSVKASGTYDIVKDALDFLVRSQFFKKESLVGRVVHPLTSPLTKLLLEFKLTGSLDEPVWRYIQILDRIF